MSRRLNVDEHEQLAGAILQVRDELREHQELVQLTHGVRSRVLTFRYRLQSDTALLVAELESELAELDVEPEKRLTMYSRPFRQALTHNERVRLRRTK